MLTIALPMPPSANNMFANLSRGGRIVSKKYAAWRTEAGWTAKAAWQAAGSPKFSGKLRLTIQLGLAFNADISNRVKPIEDLLVKSIPDFPDDCWNDEIIVRRAEIEGAIVTVEAL